MKSVRCATVLASILVIMFICGCQSVPQSSSQLILGAWQSEVGGFPLVYQYSDSTVKIAGHAEVNYYLDKDQLSIDSEGAAIRVVSFPSEDEMHQTDPMTGSVHTFTRIQ